MLEVPCLIRSICFNLFLFVIFSKGELLAVIGQVGSGKVGTLQEVLSIYFSKKLCQSHAR